MSSHTTLTRYTITAKTMLVKILKDQENEKQFEFSHRRFEPSIQFEFSQPSIHILTTLVMHTTMHTPPRLVSWISLGKPR